MIAYRYNKITGEYMGEIERQIDPLETKKAKKKIYLLPANSTDKKPLKETAGKVNVFENNEWVLKDDYRGEYYNIETQEKVIINQIGVKPDNILTDKKPLDDICKWTGSDWQLDTVKIAERDKKTALENVIKEKMRIQAIEALKTEGVLDVDGNLI